MKYIVCIDDHEYTVEIDNWHSRPIIAVVDGVAFEVHPGMIDANSLPTAPAQASPFQSQSSEAHNSVAMRTPAVPASPQTPPATSSRPPIPGTGSIVRAPIPGVILEILVKPGDTVKPAQELFIIEAMKMKNTVRSNRDGVIGEVLVAPGTTVNHNAPIISFQEG